MDVEGMELGMTPVSSEGDGTMADEVKLNPPTAALSEKSGKTRGKNPRDIKYLAFDLEKTDTLPKDMKTFMAVTKTTSEADLLDYAIGGYNDSQYSAASDEIGEFIDDAWDKEYQNQFRLTVRNFSKLSGKSIEDTVTMVMPAVKAGWEAKVAAKKAAAENPVPVSA